jgi:DNA-binding MarR family transcriptional regulator
MCVRTQYAAGMSRTKLAAEAWGAVLRARAALVPQMDRVLEDEAGLPLRWYDVMLELATAPDSRLTMGELADRVVLSRTRVSRVVDELEASGLVRRHVNEADRRSAYAVLTAAGRRSFDAAAPVYRRAITSLFAASLNDLELTAVRDALGRVVAGQGEDARTRN